MVGSNGRQDDRLESLELEFNLLKTENERIRALADLIGGQEITEQTLELAQEMLQSFQIK